MINSYKKIIDVLKTANSIAVFMHINPDCDCIGSAIALSLFMRKNGKKVTFFTPDLTSLDSISDKYKFLPHVEEFNVVDLKSYDLAVGVDIGDAGRIGDVAFKKFIKCKKTVVIDHHEIHEDFAQYTLRESDAASTTQILYKIMKEYNENLIDKEIATLLFAGLLTDSGGFTFDNTTEETHLVAAGLMKYGVESAYLSEKLLKNIEPNVFELKNRVLSKTLFYENGRIGVIIFREADFKETNTSEKNTDGIINNVINVTSVDLAISIAEIGDKKYKLSYRSKNDVNAAACAKCFGGGGHFRAAGCRLYGYFEDVLEKVLSAAREMI